MITAQTIDDHIEAYKQTLSPHELLGIRRDDIITRDFLKPTLPSKPSFFYQFVQDYTNIGLRRQIQSALEPVPTAAQISMNAYDKLIPEIEEDSRVLDRAVALYNEGVVELDTLKNELKPILLN